MRSYRRVYVKVNTYKLTSYDQHSNKQIGKVIQWKALDENATAIKEDQLSTVTQILLIEKVLRDSDIVEWTNIKILLT